jgi:hypothetical protein
MNAMLKRTFTLGCLVAALLLTGCGKNPASLSTQRVVSFKRQLPEAKPSGAQTSAAPTVSALPGAGVQPGVRLVNGQPVVAAPAATTGAMSLRVRTFGSMPVGSLLLNIASRVDPTQVALVPLAVVGSEASWQHEDLLPGGYDLRIEVRDPAGNPIGSGSAVAQVVAGEMAAVTLDVTIEAPVVTNPITPGGNPGAAGETPAPEQTASPTTEEPVTGQGGTLGLRVEFI